MIRRCRNMAVAAASMGLFLGCRGTAPRADAGRHSRVAVDGAPTGALGGEAPIVRAPSFRPPGPPPTDPVTQVAVGNHFACALRASGFVDCWGMLPDPSPAILLEPYRVQGIADAAQVVARGAIMCARSRSGSVSCLVGSEHEGEAGRPSAVPIGGMDDADDIAVASGSQDDAPVTVCARSRGPSRSVKCWSEHVGRFDKQRRALVVKGIPPARELVLDAGLASGSSYGCILDDRGAMHCWGMASEPVLPEAHDRSSFGVGAAWRVDGLPPLEHVAVASRVGVGIRKADHRAIGWGPKFAAGTWSEDAQPPRVGKDEITARPALDDADSFLDLDCARVRGGLACDGSAAARIPAQPPPLPAHRGAVALSKENGCLLGTDGRVVCWGTNHGGTLAAPTSIPLGASTPVPVVELNGVVDIAVSHRLSCGLRRDDTVHCWGANTSSSTAGAARPSRSKSTTPQMFGHGVQSLAGGGTVCELFGPDRVECFRPLTASGEYDGPIPIRGVRGVRAVLGSYGETFVTLDDGRVLDLDLWTWNVVPRPASPHGLRAAAHACAIARAAEQRGTPAGPVVCLDDGTSSAPQWRATGIDDARSLVSGRHFTCALHGIGTVSCWGTAVPRDGAESHRLDHPTAINDPPDAVGIAAGEDALCAWRRDGDVRCWGGRRSSGFATPNGFVPADFAPALKGVARIALGVTHGCALRRDGLVVCFGRNYEGELGDGSIVSTGPNAPAAIPLH